MAVHLNSTLTGHCSRESVYQAHIVDTSTAVKKQSDDRWMTKTATLHQRRCVTIVNHAGVHTTLEQKLHNMLPAGSDGVHQRRSTMLIRLVHIILYKTLPEQITQQQQFSN